jgi:hypothetical protein
MRVERGDVTTRGPQVVAPDAPQALMKPTAPEQMNASNLAIDPAVGLSLSR